MATEINEVEETLDLPDIKEGEEDTTDWKAKAQELQQKAIKQRERTKELKSELKRYQPEPKADPKPENKSSNDLDNGQKALLVAYGVKGTDEMALAKSWMQRTGDDIDVMIGDDIFTSKLNALREAKATAQAVPSNTKRSAQSSKDDQGYWNDKYLTGTPINDVPREFRMNAIKARTKGENAGKMFYNS